MVQPIRFKNFSSNATHDMMLRSDLFENLYNRYSPKMYGFLLKKVSTKEVAEQLLMDVFLRIWENIDDYKKDPEKKVLREILIISRVHNEKTSLAV
jgi:DNA-directed RNA polymerase specialized sigma24 family protein